MHPDVIPFFLRSRSERFTLIRLPAYKGSSLDRLGEHALSMNDGPTAELPPMPLRTGASGQAAFGQRAHGGPLFVISFLLSPMQLPLPGAKDRLGQPPP